MTPARPWLFALSLLLPFAGLAQAVDSRKHQLDVQQYSFSIQLNDDNDTIKGQAVVTVHFLQPSAGFDLDLVKKKATGKGMTVTAVSEHEQPIGFSQDEETLHLITQAKAGETYRYTIVYEGVPADGLIIDKNKYGHRTFFADNWPNRAHNWLPCVDHPSDKAPVEFIVTAPEHYQVVSNGLQTEETSLPNHFKLTHWRETVALPTKIMVIGVADFAVNYAGEVDCIPVSSWVYPENKDKGFYDYALAKKILPFFIKNIGPYPYRKLANVQSKTIFGGMENASAIFYFENSVKGDRTVEALLTHEIAHQWFGDYMTEASWQHIWLSEGFATYMTHCYIEKTYGADSMRRRLRDDRREVIAFFAKKQAPVVDTSVTGNFMQLLNANSYQKGGWVLHMLRRKLGDIVFWKGLRAYYTRYGGLNATTEDFRKVMEKASGQNLQSFFRQWLYTPGQPTLDARWEYDAVKKIITIRLQQMQSPLFTFPLEIGIRSGKTNTVKSFMIKGRQTSLSILAATRPASLTLDPNMNLLFNG
ncbi:MAG TPA: M1 family metallopeptidase, partial [Chitinophagaceae bacterium]|nr:M1 family metallopeptidase [Chitinophagaceae bacterium]